MARNTNGAYYALRWKILERDNFTCQYCGQHAPNVKLEVDHKIPIKDGGTDEPDNLITSCYACNRGKSGLQIINNRSINPAKRFKFPTRTIAHRREELLQLLSNKPMKAMDIAKELDISVENTMQVLSRTRRNGLIEKVGKLYQLKVT